MKKIMTLFFCISLVSATCFAEFLISPSIGFSNVFSTDPRYSTSWTPMTFGVDIGTVKRNGFTFMFSNNFSTLGKLKSKGEEFDCSSSPCTWKKIKNEAKITGGVFWKGNLLFGYTFSTIPNLYITCASGLTGGAGFIAGNEISDFAYGNGGMLLWNVGVPIHCSLNYYFTRQIGATIGLVDSLSFGMFEYGAGGFTNVFTMKFGAIFKL